MQPINNKRPNQGTPNAQQQRKQHLSYSSNIKPLGSVAQGTAQTLFGQKASKQLPKRDPAPSRTSYKLQRLWLTPIVRSMAKAAIPTLGLFAIGFYLVNNQGLRDHISTRYAETRESIQTRPEFMVDLMKVNGATDRVGDQVREASKITLPASSFELDLPIIRKRIEALDSVKAASLFLRTGGVLDIVVEQRNPVVIWRNQKGLELLDGDGVRAGVSQSRLDYAELPLIAGEGADANIAQAMSIFAAARPFENRVRGLMRIGARRWDLVLDRGQIIQLPETEPVAAVERLVAWQSAQQILARDIKTIDLRNPSRPYLRLTPFAMEELRRVRSINLGVETKL
ncbi:cell division protein FtsQ [Amylibacter ulvae]|uniref:Cell division protein FtsQ n=1 Tax=Paramylibacter ulvae TaxID=1651968 RepID=A0ABQ3D2K2_9RHOB|nr:cell division protein FtsQ/DivIB [Amylibacter ulvae]GHA52758.1 cell division protein FtsQ [Amylibacter ulvae]